MGIGIILFLFLLRHQVMFHVYSACRSDSSMTRCIYRKEAKGKRALWGRAATQAQWATAPHSWDPRW